MYQISRALSVANVRYAFFSLYFYHSMLSFACLLCNIFHNVMICV